ncbi:MULTISPECIES: glutamate--cysteine ligase [unclassified Nocardioides]|uniref:carboxylate-amine ligase n=1 Tax=unclassified Nocardioides TaxID=2615069 RepID=UPI0006F60F5A|nr:MULTISPECIES: glutamate--cysteine ligase [unclassified Nocardioides]KQY51707.1 carboxylate--amine ligase [Nocardioides sp. Root140]KQZ70686.1 carboxylate--amine ligase [Nocardioides sp. Root151]KRF11044.1 carboxylate--amine ligase [Nocardioides sp. Soil796]
MNERSRTGTPDLFRTVGVEEELLLVDAETGAPRSTASHVLRVAARHGDGEADADDVGGSVGPELQEQQVETDTPPEEDLGLLEIQLGTWREKARAAAAESGTLVLASGTTPLPVRPQTFDDERYSEMADRFGLTASEQLTCGCHVHVSVSSDDEAVGALDRIRVWLPVLLAVSANSPYWQGTDSGYDSYRSQALTRWPTNGPTEVFGSGRAYDEHLRRLTDTGVPLDEGMAYFDARPSRRYPTLEVRVADVCLDPRDAVLVAALARGLVSTAAADWRRGVEPDSASVALLRLAMWQAGKRGTSGDLLDPVTHRPKPAREVVESLVAHVASALEATGDTARVQEGVDRVFSRGTGAARQRAIVAEEGRLDRAVVRLARLT